MPDSLRAFVAVTDNDWFRFLSAHEGLDEVNFWQSHTYFRLPSQRAVRAALEQV